MSCNVVDPSRSIQSVASNPAARTADWIGDVVHVTVATEMCGRTFLNSLPLRFDQEV
jgi:hypothetical protein